MYPACNAHAAHYIAICGLSGSTTFYSALFHKRPDFWKRKMLNKKRMFLLSLQISLKYF